MRNFIMDTGTSEDEFKVTCSDEELAADFTENYAGWEPKPETITWLFETIAKEKTLPLNWKWEYGKRPPTPLHEESDSEEEEEDEK
ncbi:hypothetical protein Avbf_00983 [Armadillidium vulgare]|nr:hypothetical protein Avbf_00983 [Armadillidium vulgare]